MFSFQCALYVRSLYAFRHEYCVNGCAIARVTPETVQVFRNPKAEHKKLQRQHTGLLHTITRLSLRAEGFPLQMHLSVRYWKASTPINMCFLEPNVCASASFSTIINHFTAAFQPFHKPPCAEAKNYAGIPQSNIVPKNMQSIWNTCASPTRCRNGNKTCN